MQALRIATTDHVRMYSIRKHFPRQGEKLEIGTKLCGTRLNPLARLPLVKMVQLCDTI